MGSGQRWRDVWPRALSPPKCGWLNFGIRGFDLAYALLDGYDATVFIDATPRGGEPGTIYTIEPDLSELRPGGRAADDG